MSLVTQQNDLMYYNYNYKSYSQCRFAKDAIDAFYSQILAPQKQKYYRKISFGWKIYSDKIFRTGGLLPSY